MQYFFKLFYFFHDLYILTYTLQSIQANILYFTFFLKTSGMKDFGCIYIYLILSHLYFSCWNFASAAFCEIFSK